MANLGEGAAVLAHELKNPLGIIRGSAEILIKGRDSSEQNEILHFILDETDRLTALVDDFMRFARMAPPEKTETSLDDLVQSVAFLWESRRKSPTPLNIRFALGLGGETVPLDSRQVYQVLLNLFSNAEDAMPQGGELLLATGLNPSNGLAWISIRDTGKGISEKDLSRVFDRFFTTKESGLGLGLALVKKVAEAHGGSVRIESTVGQGTKVTLFFPR
jgi:signal transduction histidine kinase